LKGSRAVHQRRVGWSFCRRCGGGCGLEMYSDNVSVGARGKCNIDF